MQSLWDDAEAAEFSGDLGLRVYTSRLLGRDPSLVLHGGGNTSVKIREADIFGDEQDVLYVKGSGWDLVSIEEPGFAPVRMDHLVRLSGLSSLSDTEMVNELKTNTLKVTAPTPSVEAILHAILPYKFVDHTHADAVVAITNTAEGEKRIREIYADTVVVIPYVMPGFDLARECAARFNAESHAGTLGMVLMNHGVFSFANTAKASYQRMIDLISRAEEYLQRNDAWEIERPAAGPAIPADAHATIAELRAEICRLAERPMIMRTTLDAAGHAFANRREIAEISQRGPATPDHIIRTKRMPMLGRGVESFARDYAEYFLACAATHAKPVKMLDPAPRVVLDPEFGLLTVGKSAAEADIVADIYRHTMDVIDRSTRLGGFRAVPVADLFAVEYWELEQAKLKKPGVAPAFQGEIALITGAASGIGRACVTAFLRRGASVIGLDLDASVEDMEQRPDYLGVQCNVTDARALHSALKSGVLAFGGLDMLVLNAGMFPGGKTIAQLDMDTWRSVMRVNLDANLNLLRDAHPLLELSPGGGRVVVIGSKNVPAPGPGAAAYSASKAALNQLVRVAALEWGAAGIRINTLHPDAVFDTGIWTEDVLRSRAGHYGLTVDEYKRKNVLGTQIRSRDVAELAAELCGPLFAKTTAAQIPVDGGNDRVI